MNNRPTTPASPPVFSGHHRCESWLAEDVRHLGEKYREMRHYREIRRCDRAEQILRNWPLLNAMYRSSSDS